MVDSLVLRGTMSAHTDSVTAIATPIDNSDMIVTSSHDKSIIVWHLTKEDKTYGVAQRRLTGSRADPSKIQLPCAKCKVLLNVPHALLRFNCPQFKMELMVDLSGVKQFYPPPLENGLLFGDGAGVGKGRTSAGLIWENWQHRIRKALWISVGSYLKW